MHSVGIFKSAKSTLHRLQSKPVTEIKSEILCDAIQSVKTQIESFIDAGKTMIGVSDSLGLRNSILFLEKIADSLETIQAKLAEKPVTLFKQV
jgi:hypothetical protein